MAQTKRSNLYNFAICTLLFAVFLLFLSGCGTYDTEEATGGGSIAFSVKWEGAPNRSNSLASIRAASFDCAANGVSTVEATVYDSSSNTLAYGGTWTCSAGNGSISNVPAGSNRKVVVVAKDSSGTILYQGEKTGITVIAGQTTNIGQITLALSGCGRWDSMVWDVDVWC